MTKRDFYMIESKLLKDIEREKKFTWHKFVKIMELEALLGANKS